MKNLYKKASFDDYWKLAESFSAALDSLSDDFVKKEVPLENPLFNVIFHMVESYARAMLLKHAGKLIGGHSETFSAFKTRFGKEKLFEDIIGFYKKILEKNYAVLYNFDKNFDRKQVLKFIEKAERFRNRVRRFEGI